MANLSALLNATLSVTDTTLTPNATIVTRNLNNPTLSATTVYYDPFLQVGTTAVSFAPPTSPIYIVYIKNLGSSANILFSWTPVGGSSINVGIIAPGGVFVYFMPTESAGSPIGGLSNGVQGVELVASAAATSAEVLFAA